MLCEGACNGHPSVFWHAVHLHPSMLSSSSSGMPSWCLIYEPKYEVQAVSMRLVYAGCGPVGERLGRPAPRRASLSPAALYALESGFLQEPPPHAANQPRSMAASVNAYEQNSALGRTLPLPQAGTGEKLPHCAHVHAHKMVESCCLQDMSASAVNNPAARSYPVDLIGSVPQTFVTMSEGSYHRLQPSSQHTWWPYCGVNREDARNRCLVKVPAIGIL